jgi:hypothetical protein
VISAELALAFLCLLLAGLAVAMMWELYRQLRELRAAAVGLQEAAAAATAFLEAQASRLRGPRCPPGCGHLGRWPARGRPSPYRG